MKTTIEIADPILRRAKRLAARRRTTLRAVVESALRHEIDRDAAASRTNTEIRARTFEGRGLQAGLSWDDFGALLERAYEGRGS